MLIHWYAHSQGWQRNVCVDFARFRQCEEGLEKITYYKVNLTRRSC